ncbi:MAG: hypothetical protein B6244_11675 [Candidatus Cloacimonetes bacterium 4572_55]|nr:MAG: hypothetical protein B6244_11675 [Candidatus Cloacimonetes bacterium 4572_55]
MSKKNSSCCPLSSEPEKILKWVGNARKKSISFQKIDQKFIFSACFIKIMLEKIEIFPIFFPSFQCE